MSGQNETISLTVEKSIPSDVVTAEPNFWRFRPDLKPGDIVLIKGEKRSTAAIYWEVALKITKCNH